MEHRPRLHHMRRVDIIATAVTQLWDNAKSHELSNDYNTGSHGDSSTDLCAAILIGTVTFTISSSTTASLENIIDYEDEHHYSVVRSA
jgi:hypothetical protein